MSVSTLGDCIIMTIMARIALNREVYQRSGLIRGLKGDFGLGDLDAVPGQQHFRRSTSRTFLATSSVLGQAQCWVFLVI